MIKIIKKSKLWPNFLLFYENFFVYAGTVVYNYDFDRSYRCIITKYIKFYILQVLILVNFIDVNTYTRLVIT